MYRFFVQTTDIHDNTISLDSDITRHIRSLRLRPDELFVVCDGEGLDYICMLGDKSGDNSFDPEAQASQSQASSTAEIFDKFPSQGEPAMSVSVYMAYSKGDRLDYAIQKAVELGAYEIVLFPSARCVAIPNDPKKKTARLQKIALETAKQSNRGIVPQVKAVKSFSEATSLASEADLPLFFYELEEGNGLKKILEQAVDDSINAPIRTISILTGPEGGFMEHEAGAGVQAGMKSASLGVRILRSETAPITALSAIMFFFGEM